MNQLPFYRFPETSFLGSYSRIYATIETDNKHAIIFHVSCAVFPPKQLAEELNNDIKSYRGMLKKNFLNEAFFTSIVTETVPHGYFIEKNSCFVLNGDLTNVRNFGEMYSDISFTVQVSIGTKFDMYENTPTIHNKCIMNLFDAIDKKLGSMQQSTGDRIVIVPQNIGRVRTLTKDVALSVTANDLTYLLKKDRV